MERTVNSFPIQRLPLSKKTEEWRKDCVDYIIGISGIASSESIPDEEEMQRMPPPPKGVMGVTPAIVGSVEATEVLKIICDFGDVLAGELWTIDLRTWQSNKFSL